MSDLLKRLRLQLMPFILAFLTLIPLVLFAVVSVVVFESALTPIYQDRTTIVATGVQRRLEISAMMFGDLAALRDVAPFLDEVREASPDIDFIAITDAQARVLYSSMGEPLEEDAVAGLLAARGGSALDAQLSVFGRGASQLFSETFGASVETAGDGATRRVDDYVITSLPIRAGQVEIGRAHAGVAVSVFERMRIEVVFNAATFFLAALMIGYESLRLLFAVHIRRPVRMLRFLSERLRSGDLRYVAEVDGRGGVSTLVASANAFIQGAVRRAGGAAPGLTLPGDGAPGRHILPASEYIRLPLFLFFLSEAILRPFLPAYLESLSSGGADLASPMQVGAALSAFMVASIIGVVGGSFAADRASVRLIFIAGVGVTCAGMAMHIGAQDMVQAVGARAVSGMGYGLAYAAAQVYIAHHAERRRKATGFSMFLAVVVAAEISGPVIGGILVDRFGYNPTFAVAAAVLVVSVLLAAWILPSRRPDTLIDAPAPKAPAADRPRWMPVGGMRFAMITLCFSIPAKLLLNGGLFLLIPLLVNEAGGSAVDAGRVIMVYGLAVLVSTGWLSRLADRWGLFGQWIFWGGVISGIGFCIPAFAFSMPALALAVALFGLGQAMSIPAQITFLLSVTRREAERFGQGAILGAFRFVERIGSLLGPVIAASLLTLYGLTEALFILGAYSLISVSAGAAYFLTVGEQDEEEAIDALLVEG